MRKSESPQGYLKKACQKCVPPGGSFLKGPSCVSCIFIMVWLVTAVVFLGLTIGARQTLSFTLARYSPGFPEAQGSAKLLGVDLVKTLTEMCEANNENVDRLEESLRGSAKLMFWLNLISFCAALAGLCAQVAQHGQGRQPDRGEASPPSGSWG